MAGIALQSGVLGSRCRHLWSALFGDSIEGEAREVGFVMAGIALQSGVSGNPCRHLAC